MVFIMYDISDNLTRSNFIKKLQHFGLRRVQKSVFCGILDIESRLDLANDFDLFISSENDSIMLIPCCNSCSDSVFIEGDLSLPKEENYVFL